LQFNHIKTGSLIKVGYNDYRIFVYEKNTFNQYILENRDLILTVVDNKEVSGKYLNGIQFNRIFTHDANFIQILTDNKICYICTRYKLMTIEE